MNSNIDDKELVSALADGQLDAQAAQRGLLALAQDPQARERWHTYHLIGDVLRSPELARSQPSAHFMQRLSQRLKNEPLPGAMPAGAGRSQAANDARFSWKLAAALASVAMVAVAGWLALGSGQAPMQAQLAGTSVPRVGMVVTGTDRGPMLRDPQLDELLAAHRQLGGATALQAPAAGLHNATFEPPSR